MKYSIKIDDKRSSKGFQCGTCGRCCGERASVSVEDVERLITKYPLENFLYFSEEKQLLSFLPNCKGKDMLLKQGIKTLTWTESGYDPNTNSRYTEIHSRTADDYCVFLQENGLCSVHEIKPDVCRLYPFRVAIENIDENIILVKLVGPRHKLNPYECYPENCKGRGVDNVDRDEILDLAQKMVERYLRDIAAILHTQEETRKDLISNFQRLSRDYHQTSLDEAIEIIKLTY